MAKIPVGATIARAYRFTFEGFLRILGVMWPSLLLMWVPGILLRPQMMALSAQMASQNYSGLRELWPVFVLFYPMMLVLLVMQVIGIAQLALDRHKGPAWFYFSLGKPVWRWIGSFLLLIAVMLVGWLVVALADVAVVALLRALMGSAGNVALTVILGLVIFIFVLASFCALFYCWIRLSFFPVHAGDCRR